MRPIAAAVVGASVATLAIVLRQTPKAATAAGVVSSAACLVVLRALDSASRIHAVLTKGELLAMREASLLGEPESLLREQLSRNLHFLGERCQAKLGNSLVVVIGLGSVGSHAAALLGRSGIGCLRLVDPAKVSDASLTHHATAVAVDVGNGRAAAVRDALSRTVPALAIQVCETRLVGANAPTLLADADFVLLCTRDSEALVAGLMESNKAGVRALACLSGPMARGDAAPSHQRLMYLHETLFLPEARTLTRQLRDAIGGHLPMPLPDQLVIAPIPPSISPWPQSSQFNKNLDHTAWWFSGSGGSIPIEVSPPPRSVPALAAAGHAAASAVLCALGELTLDPFRTVFPRSVREDMWRAVARRERDVFGVNLADNFVHRIWPEDIEYLVDEVYGRRCAKTGESLGGRFALVLTRWRAELPISRDNAILLMKTEAAKHDEQHSLEGIPCEVVSAIDAALRRPCMTGLR